MENFSYCKLEIFIPASHLEALRQALCQAGAGHIGRYDSCLSYSPVTGCWRPLEGSRPCQGTVGVLCEAQELKVEAACQRSRVDACIAAIRAIHPYEEPVINAIPLYRTGLPAGEPS